MPEMSTRPPGVTAASHPTRTRAPNLPPPATSAGSRPRAVVCCGATTRPRRVVADCRCAAVRCGRRRLTPGSRTRSRWPSLTHGLSHQSLPARCLPARCLPTRCLLAPCLPARSLPAGAATALAAATRIPTQAARALLPPAGAGPREVEQTEVATQPRRKSLNSTCVHRLPALSIPADSVHRLNP
jgi:hypothetical protein